jgi:hypothetical protein
MNGSMASGNYSVTSAGGSAVNGAAERTIKWLNADGTTATALKAGQKYILRVYTADILAIDVGSFDAKADNSLTIYFGKITFGSDVA